MSIELTRVVSVDRPLCDLATLKVVAELAELATVFHRVCHLLELKL
jgi:hypothetical protein